MRDLNLNHPMDRALYDAAKSGGEETFMQVLDKQVRAEEERYKNAQMPLPKPTSLLTKSVRIAMLVQSINPATGRPTRRHNVLQSRDITLAVQMGSYLASQMSN